jgi:Na+-transporting NADH:ubiquinone oxidoreductase subunit C
MKQRILMVLFTVAVTVAFISPVSFLYLITRQKVRQNEEAFVKKAVLSAAGIAVSGGNEGVIPVFSARIEEMKSGAEPLYRVKDKSGGTAGYVLTKTGPGLWGEITATVGFDADGQGLTGVDFLRQSETPGLGARISEKWFREQFRGKRGPFTTVPEGEKAAEDQFDAITGATVTSNAVKAILNSAVAQAKELAK